MKSMLVIDTKELFEYGSFEDEFGTRFYEIPYEDIMERVKQLPSKEHLTSVLENGDLFIKNHTLQDIINTIYGDNK